MTRKQKKFIGGLALMLVALVITVLQESGQLPQIVVTNVVISPSVVTSTFKVVASSTTAIVARVVDGDTIALETGEKVRYIGVNTPESIDPRRGVQCFGKEASAYNKSLVEGKLVRLEKDVSDTDRYGRLLRYVYLEDGTFVNLKLVEDGYAQVDTVPPDVTHKVDFLAAQAGAREAKRGLWGACK